MDENNERMQYSFEPSEPVSQPQEQPADREEPARQEPAYQQSSYRYYQQPAQQTYEPAQQTEQPKKQKKDHKGLKLTALLVAVALVAGIAGAVLSGVISNISRKNAEKNAAEQTTAAVEDLPKTEEAAKTEKQESFARKTQPLPDTLIANAGDKSLSPKQVYNMNVNAVIGIATEGSMTNGWGQISRYSTAGTGFLFTADGYIITNNHVIDGSDTITVKLYNGEEYGAEIIGGDASNDVALLKIEGTDFPFVTIGDSEQIEVGEQVVAIGNPLGELTNTMTVGYISALDREINTDGTPINMLQTDAAINSGNSGGPLFDMNGNVIGITSAKYSGQTSSGAYIESINFAIPINDAMRIVYDLQQYGYVKNRPYLGITLKDLDQATAKNYGLPVGPIIQTVTEGSCAEKAGIAAGDIIIGFNGKEITCYTDLAAALKKCMAGDTVEVKLYRSGAEQTVSVILDERPQDSEVEATEEEANQTQPDTEVQPVNPYDDGNGGGSYGYGFPFGMDPFEFFGFGN